jgi:hypothetical protein
MAKLKTAVIRWLDGDMPEMTVTVCEIEKESEYTALMLGIEKDDPEIMAVDSRVWFYFDDPKHPISDYFEKQNGTDFILLSVSEDFELWEIEKEANG